MKGAILVSLACLSSCVTHPKTAHEKRFSYSISESIDRGLFMANYDLVSKPGEVQKKIGLQPRWLDSVWFEKGWVNRGQYSLKPGYKVFKNEKGQLIGKVSARYENLLNKNLVLCNINGVRFSVSGLHRAVLDGYIIPSDTIVAYLESIKHPSVGPDTLLFVKRR